MSDPSHVSRLLPPTDKSNLKENKRNKLKVKYPTRCSFFGFTASLYSSQRLTQLACVSHPWTVLDACVCFQWSACRQSAIHALRRQSTFFHFVNVLPRCNVVRSGCVKYEPASLGSENCPGVFLSFSRVLTQSEDTEIKIL